MQASELLRSRRMLQKLIGICSTRESAPRDTVRQHCRHLQGGLCILPLVQSWISLGTFDTPPLPRQLKLSTYWWPMISTLTQEEVAIARLCCPSSSSVHSRGVPLTLSKTARGDTVAWVGFKLMLRRNSTGISTRRADWFTKWTREVASNPVVNMDTFEELGRVTWRWHWNTKESRKREAPLVCDGNRRGHISQGRRTGERGKDGNRRMATRRALAWSSAEVTQEGPSLGL